MTVVVEDELKRLSRRTEELQKTVDLLFQDRAILEDILTRLSQVELALRANQKNQTVMQQDTKNEIQEVKAATKEKVEEVKELLDTKTVVVKKKRKWRFWR